ncbi:MAG: GlxA family transcriptional regulator [Pseudomonadaceae bacterium]|nr:MAG: GlxA family transcriptional regulator [Pseudomonadaceae bacterium]
MASELRHVGFLLWPGASPVVLMPALAVLRSANRLAERECYQVTCLTLDEHPIVTPEGLQWPANPLRELRQELSSLWLVADTDQLPAQVPVWLAPLLRQWLHDGVELGAIEAGVFPLAMTGLLDGCRCAVHWRMLDEFRERFPAVEATSQLFVEDRKRVTSSGLQATVDLFLNHLVEQQGQDLAALVAEDLTLERTRDATEKQRVPLRNRLGSSHPKLTQAVILMEANIEEPLTTDEIANHVCVSRRQLERIFRQYLDSVPSQYYLEMRLNRARQMLLQTSKSIIQIGLSCGFSSGPHFSSAYRNFFGITPREDRNRRRAQQQDATV